MTQFNYGYFIKPKGQTIENKINELVELLEKANVEPADIENVEWKHIGNTKIENFQYHGRTGWV